MEILKYDKINVVRIELAFQELGSKNKCDKKPLCKYCRVQTFMNDHVAALANVQIAKSSPER